MIIKLPVTLMQTFTLSRSKCSYELLCYLNNNLFPGFLGYTLITPELSRKITHSTTCMVAGSSYSSSLAIKAPSKLLTLTVAHSTPFIISVLTAQVV